MTREYLIAVDLEGIHGVLGEAYKNLTESVDYAVAIEGAYHEINAVVETLFACGVENVAVWDCHGKGANLDFSRIDARVERIDASKDAFRYDFVRSHQFAGMFFLGYHAMEGTRRAILAHSYNSSSIQYIRVNGQGVGELYVDSVICGGYGIAPLFVASDEQGVAEMRAMYPTIETVTTKYGEGRNRGTLRERAVVLDEIRAGVTAALAKEAPVVLSFPRDADVEIRYTRAERAEAVYARICENGLAPVRYGADSHTLHFTVSEPNHITKLL